MRTKINVAHQMAQAWIRQGTDPNEVAKSLRYLTEHPDARHFFLYLRTVVHEGRAVVRSGRSLDYYRQIEQVCREHLGPYQGNPETMAQVLGWAVRLMRYYQVEPNLQRPLAPKPKPARARVQPSAAPTAERRIGQVKWFNDQKRFGFIQPDQGGNDVFVHISGLAPGVNTLLPGQRVEFEMGTGPKGRPQAVAVRPVV